MKCIRHQRLADLSGDFGDLQFGILYGEGEGYEQSGEDQPLFYVKLFCKIRLSTLKRYAMGLGLWLLAARKIRWTGQWSNRRGGRCV